MNIAIEVSPLLTASGSFGDKSGVYRYTYGLLKALIHVIEKEDPQSKVILFTFAPKLLAYSLNPEILALTEKKNVEFIDYQSKIFIQKKKENDWIDFFNIPYLNILLKGIDRLFRLRKIYAIMADRRAFARYIKNLELKLINKNVQVVLHSETGFFPLKLKSAITVYDLTTVFLPHFHRIETCDLQMRKLRFAKKHCDGILAISESTKKDLIYYSHHFENKKIIVAYPGLDQSFGKHESHTIEYLNKIVGNNINRIESKKYFLYYGTFEPRKNIAYVVQAFADLMEKKLIPKDYKMVLIGGKGWGQVREMVEYFIKENYPLPENNPFILMDYINDEHLYSFIKHSTAVIYPSIYEGFGLPVLESIALGTPVISSDTSSLPEVGGDAVLYANPKDFNKIKEQMVYIINNPEKRNELSDKGIQQSKKFDWNVTAREVYRFLQQI